MQYNLSGLFALPAHYLMGVTRDREKVRDREGARKVEKDRDSLVLVARQHCP